MQAVLLALAGFFCFTLMDLSIKWLLQSHSLMQVTFFNCLFAMAGLFLWNLRDLSVLKTSQPKIHLLRALIVLVVDLLAFYSYGEIPLAEAYTLILTMPLFTVVFSILCGYEAPQLRQLILSFLGFFGILLVLAPGFDRLQLAMLAALLSAVIEAVGFLMVTQHRQQESPQAFAFYGLALLVVTTGVFTLTDYQPMSSFQWSLSLGGGICYALASALVVAAFHRGRPGAVSGMQYTQLFWGMLLALLIWEEVPSLTAMLGALVIVVAGLLLMAERPSSDPVDPEHSGNAP